MKSRIADEAECARLKREQEMTPGARIARALRLGRRNVRMFASANNLPLDEARAKVREQKNLGRRTKDE